MTTGGVVAVTTGVVVVAALLLSWAVQMIKQYERGGHFRLGLVMAVHEPGLRLIIPRKSAIADR